MRVHTIVCVFESARVAVMSAVAVLSVAAATAAAAGKRNGTPSGVLG